MFPVTSEEKFASHSSNNPDRWDNIWKDSGKALLTGGAAIAAGEGISAVARNSGPLMGRVINTVRERVPVTRYAPFMSDASFSGGSQILRDRAGNIVSRAYAYPGNIVGSQGAARVAGGTATQRAVGTGLNRAGQSQLQVGVSRAGQKLVDQGVVAPTRLGLPMPPGPHQLSLGFKRGGTINKFQRGNVLTNREQHLVDVSRLPKLSIPQVWGRKLFGTGPKPVETGRTHLNKAGEQVPEVGNRVIMPGGRDNTTITRGTNYGSG